MGHVAPAETFRIGRRRVARVPRTRSILVKFCDRRDVDPVMANVQCLKNTSYGILRDYPVEICEARKELWPEYKRAREQHGYRNVKFLFPAAIKIRGQITRDLFPCWHSFLRESRNSDVKAQVQQRVRVAMQNANVSDLANSNNDSEKSVDHQDIVANVSSDDETSESIPKSDIARCLTFTPIQKPLKSSTDMSAGTKDSSNQSTANTPSGKTSACSAKFR